ncbi:MAG: hypothetical protein C4531_16825 [Desulfurivibrio sp.]|nr:MAG: hypothetical protein C4531_16825 [Desulfurivibrio sp.]
MGNNIRAIIEKIKKLENELAEEIQKKEEQFSYRIHEETISFQEEVKKKHQLLTKTFFRYLADAALPNILTAPFIWACIIPALFLDAVVSLYQFICFPVYGIPKVKREQYIIFDRQSLRYLNVIEKINCTYCGYFNGLIAYVQEIAARTEQYWCPIKHARRIVSIHSRYSHFLEFGDGDGYRSRIEDIRRKFDDIDDSK